jgi:hypothetical protein
MYEPLSEEQALENYEDRIIKEVLKGMKTQNDKLIEKVEGEVVSVRNELKEMKKKLQRVMYLGLTSMIQVIVIVVAMRVMPLQVDVPVIDNVTHTHVTHMTHVNHMSHVTYVTSTVPVYTPVHANVTVEQCPLPEMVTESFENTTSQEDAVPEILKNETITTSVVHRSVNVVAVGAQAVSVALVCGVPVIGGTLLAWALGQ